MISVSLFVAMYPSRLLENQSISHGLVVPTTVNSAAATISNAVIDTTSDSAVSSMGSERVSSISDSDWIDTNASDSNAATAGAAASVPSVSAYSMDYSSGFVCAFLWLDILGRDILMVQSLLQGQI